MARCDAMNKTEVRGILADMKTEFPNLAVSVTIGAVTGVGLRTRRAGKAQLSDNGEIGVDTGSVTLDSSVFTAPGKGDTFTIDGDDVFAVDISPEATDGIIEIQYQLQKPK